MLTLIARCWLPPLAIVLTAPALGQSPRSIPTASQPYQPEDRVLRVEVRVPLGKLLDAADASRVVEVRRVSPSSPEADPTSDPFLDESTADTNGPGPAATQRTPTAGAAPQSQSAGTMAPADVFGAFGRAIFGGVTGQIPKANLPGMGGGPGMQPGGGMETGPPADGFGPPPAGFAPPSDEDPFGAPRLRTTTHLASPLQWTMTRSEGHQRSTMKIPLPRRDLSA